MNISLKHLIPHPVKEIPHENSKIWEAESVLLEPGKKYLFTAPSGKGKTTLLAILYGIRKDYEGQVNFDSHDIRDYNDRKWAMYQKA